MKATKNIQNALQRYNSQAGNTLRQMQKPIETGTGLYMWEVWTYKRDGSITDIRYYAEGVSGGNTIRISKKDVFYLVS